MIFFIIIYGTYGITYSKGEPGQFHCPQCSVTQAYRHRRVRRFFHIFFIPLIPLNLAGEYVECGQCKGTYKLEVLAMMKGIASGVQHASQTLPLSEGQRAVRRILAMMLLADGRVEESELAAIIEFLRYAERRDVTRDEVLAEVEAARHQSADVETYCRQVMGFLNDQGKADVLKAAQVIASADGHVDPAEQKMLERMGVALGMRPQQVSSQLAQPQQLPPQAVHHQQVQPPLQQQQKAPFCPRCGAPGRWLAEHSMWGCDHCRQPIAR
jgi:tellurite resistance protein